MVGFQVTWIQLCSNLQESFCHNPNKCLNNYQDNMILFPETVHALQFVTKLQLPKRQLKLREISSPNGKIIIFASN